jgi:hypothetical protein
VYLAAHAISFFENLCFLTANAYTNNSLDFHVAQKMQQGLKIYQLKRDEMLSHSSFQDPSFETKRLERQPPMKLLPLV